MHRSKFSTQALKRLEEKGVIFARLEDLEGVESYTAVYNGEVLVQGGSAADLRKSLDGAWAKTGDDLVQELDMMHLETRNRNRSKRYNRNKKKIHREHRDNSKAISRSELTQIKVYLKELDVSLQIHPANGESVVKDYINSRTNTPGILQDTAAAAFLAKLESVGSSIMVLRKGATKFEFFHEYMHYRHAEELGIPEYLALGGYNTQGRLIKERWVYDKIIENKAYFNKSELIQAFDYINRVRDRWGKFPLKLEFDINQIPIKKPDINLEELFSKK
jgi:hypothetical protein